MNLHNWISQSASETHTVSGASATGVELVMDRDGDLYQCRLQNSSGEPVAIAEVVLATGEVDFPPETAVYGEGYSMLSQYVGDFQSIESITEFTDWGHYKLPSSMGWNTVYNLLLMGPVERKIGLLGFASARKFGGEFRFRPGRLEVVINTEGKEIRPGEQWVLEDLFVATGDDRHALLSELGGKLAAVHPRLPWAERPTGWCSWYCYGPSVTADDIVANVDAIRDRELPLTYVQIDDGYQSAMGDWLTPAPTFEPGIEPLCRKISSAGLEPAIWVAPFIAEKDSAVLREHPEWFVQGDTGSPLSSGDFSFGGWRRGPWYMLDGTHPEARDHLATVFRTMRDQWGCHYFKLDANMWGALPGGFRYDKTATRAEAYRRGMQAIVDAVGEDSFILGCNAPMWPSIGVVHGMRITGDISRRWSVIATLATEGAARNWQHHHLWLNDPDCVVLDNLKSDLSDSEFRFHETYIAAGGGLLLSGDKIVDLSEGAAERLMLLATLPDRAAAFADAAFEHGVLHCDGQTYHYLFNAEDTPSRRQIQIAATSDGGAPRVENLLTGETPAVEADAGGGYLAELTLAGRDGAVVRVS